MTWREAWSNISGRLAYAAKVQRSEFGGKGFTDLYRIAKFTLNFAPCAAAR